MGASSNKDGDVINGEETKDDGGGGGGGGGGRGERLLLIRSFHILGLVLQTLLLPLSFLLLVRLSSATEYLSFPLLTTVLLLLLHLLIPPICISALLHVTLSYVLNPNLYISWTALVVFQVTVGVGIESTIAAGVTPPADPLSSDVPWVHIQRLAFFVGVYETTLLWSRVIVRPVVNDALYGSAVEKTAGERAVVGLGFGLVSLVMIRNEVEEMLRIGRLDCVLCWIVGVMMTLIGVARIVRGIGWIGNLILKKDCVRQERRGDYTDSVEFGTADV